MPVALFLLFRKLLGIERAKGICAKGISIRHDRLHPWVALIKKSRSTCRGFDSKRMCGYWAAGAGAVCPAGAAGAAGAAAGAGAASAPGLMAGAAGRGAAGSSILTSRIVD